MGNEKTASNKFYSLVPLGEFKSLLGIDDREDKLARFCLVTATYSIEQHCMRRLLRKKHYERIEYIGDLNLPLREYPVYRMLAVYAQSAIEESEQIIDSDFYSVIPDCGSDYDLPFSLILSRALQRYQGLIAVKAVYWAGYSAGHVPADLASACLELAVWNMNRYKGRRVGMTGNVRGSGKEGEHFEMSMPENVKALIEPYKRKIF